MRVHTLICVASLLATSAASFAAPVEYDTPEYRLVVCRPFDSWSGDLDVMDGERETIASRRGRFAYRTSPTNAARRGAGLSLMNGPTDDAVTTDTVALLKSRGVDISMRGSYHWELGLGTELAPADYPVLRRVQSQLYEAQIRKQGDPEKIPGSASARRFMGNVLAFAAIGVGLNKYGAIGGSVVATAFAGDIAQLPVGVQQSFAPFDLPELDAAAFTSFEVFPVKVNEGGSAGEVVIAYKTDRMEAVRHDALVQVLVSLAGSDTTPEAIDAARALDLAHRREVWKACVSAGQCGPAADHHEEATK